MDIEKNEIIYVDIISKTITIRLKDIYSTGINHISLSFESRSSANMYLLTLIDKYDLVSTDRPNQYIVRK